VFNLVVVVVAIYEYYDGIYDVAVVVDGVCVTRCVVVCVGIDVAVVCWFAVVIVHVIYEYDVGFIVVMFVLFDFCCYRCCGLSCRFSCCWFRFTNVVVGVVVSTGVVACCIGAAMSRLLFVMLSYIVWLTLLITVVLLSHASFACVVCGDGVVVVARYIVMIVLLCYIMLFMMFISFIMSVLLYYVVLYLLLFRMLVLLYRRICWDYLSCCQYRR